MKQGRPRNIGDDSQSKQNDRALVLTDDLAAKLSHIRSALNISAAGAVRMCVDCLISMLHDRMEYANAIKSMCRGKFEAAKDNIKRTGNHPVVRFSETMFAELAETSKRCNFSDSEFMRMSIKYFYASMSDCETANHIYEYMKKMHEAGTVYYGEDGDC